MGGGGAGLLDGGDTMCRSGCATWCLPDSPDLGDNVWISEV